MKCLVFSDSHGSTALMQQALRAHPTAEAVLFLGDGIADLEAAVAADRAPIPRQYVAVRGNCDFSTSFRTEPLAKTVALTLGGYRILMTHGDLYGAKHGMEGLISLAVGRQADILLFGHTHRPAETYLPAEQLPPPPEGSPARERPLYLLNPGSAGATHPATYGILTLTEQGILFSHGTDSPCH